jgi:hypothetical protein
MLLVLADEVDHLNGLHAGVPRVPCSLGRSVGGAAKIMCVLGDLLQERTVDPGNGSTDRSDAATFGR